MAAFNIASVINGLAFPSASSLHLDALSAPENSTQTGITAHVQRILDDLPDRLVALPPESLASMCLDCSVDPDPNTGVEVRTCEACLCYVCNAADFSEATAGFSSNASAELMGTMLGCLRCGLRGAVRGIPKGKSVPFSERISQLISSTVGGRMHVGCALSRCVTGDGVIGTVRCPTCREVVFPPTHARLISNAERVPIVIPAARLQPTSSIATDALGPSASRLTSVDLFASMSKMDPRLACFNDIHAGVKEWSAGTEPDVCGIDLRRRPRTLELYLHIDKAKPLPPMELPRDLADAVLQGDALLSRLVGGKTRRSIDDDRRRRKARALETSAGAVILSEVFHIPQEEAGDLCAVLGPSIVECLADGDDLHRAKAGDLVPEARRVSSAARLQARAPTGTLGEAPFVLARANRLKDMRQRWDNVGVGVFDSSM